LIITLFGYVCCVNASTSTLGRRSVPRSRVELETKYTVMHGEGLIQVSMLNLGHHLNWLDTQGWRGYLWMSF